MAVDGDCFTYGSSWLRSGFVLVSGCLVLLVGWLVPGYLSAGRPAQAVVAAATCSALAAVAVELLWRPVVRVDVAGVTLVNPLRTTFVPWRLLVGTEAAYGLRLLTADRYHQSWAASAGPGARGPAAVRQGIVADNPLGAPFGMGTGAGPTLRAVLTGPSSSPDSRAKLMVDQAWQSWQGGTDQQTRSSDGSVLVTWHRVWATVVLVAFVVAVAGLLAV